MYNLVTGKKQASPINGHVAERHLGQARDTVPLTVNNDVVANGEVRGDIDRLPYDCLSISIDVIQEALARLLAGQSDNGYRYACIVAGEV